VTNSIPAHVFVADGIAFISCPSCSLKQSSQLAKKGPDGWKCMRCDGDLEVAPEQIAAALATAKQNVPVAQEVRHTQTDVTAVNGRATPTQGAVPGSSPGGNTTVPLVTPPPKREEPMENISEFVQMVQSKGFELSLITAAGWGVDVRKAVRMYCNAGGPIPEVLTTLKRKQTDFVHTSGYVAAPQVPPGQTHVSVFNNPAATTSDSIQTVTATWGEEKFTPVAYNGFAVGPFTATTTVRVGESTQQALDRLNADLEQYAKVAFEKKRTAFLGRLGQTQS